MTDNYSKWYHSDLASNLSGAAVILVLAFAGVYAVKGCRNEPGYKIQEAKTEEGKTVKFYIINGKPAVVEVDGKPVIDPSKITGLEKLIQKEAQKR
jgi:hypothetical protein